MNESSSPWPYLTGLLGSLASVAALWGVWLAWRRAPADHRLITAQTDATAASTKKTEAESSSLAFNVVSKALTDAERTIDRLKAERDALERQIEMIKAERKLAERPGDGRG